jgi:hypothetical protein
MSIIVKAEEIAQYRTDLAESPKAQIALNILEDCEGDLEDASITLAIHVGQEPDISDGWIDGLAKRWRHVVCQADFKEALEDGLSSEALATLAASIELPQSLTTLVAIYVIKSGVADFCKPLEEKLG